MPIRRPHSLALLLLALLAPAAACGPGELKMNVSIADVGLVVGDSVRPQWAVIRQHSGGLNPSFFVYDSFGHPDRFRWQVTNPAVVSVDDRGMVLARSPGTATVTATSRGLASPPMRVTVEAAAP